MSAADGSSSDDDDFQFGSSNVGSQRYPVHDCCEFEDVESLRRLIFVPQDDSDDDGSSGSDDSGQSSEGEDDEDSSSDDNDSTVAAHAAAIGLSPPPPGVPIAATAPVGATAAVAAGMGANMAPAGDLGFDPNVNGATSTSVSEAAPKSNAHESPAKNDAGEQEIVKEAGSHTKVSPSIDSDMTTSEGPPLEEAKKADTLTSRMDTSSDLPTEHDANMVSEQETGTPTKSVVIHTGTETNKAFKKEKKKLRTKRVRFREDPAYFCPYDLNERDGDENTPLHVAIHARKLEHAKLLLVAGASIHRKSDGSAPIHTAISIGAVPMHAAFAYECTLLLGEFNADFSVKDDSMHTPLYLACGMNLPRVVSHILSDDVGLSTLNMRADRSGGRALHAAAKFNSLSSAGYTGGSKIPREQTRANSAHHHPDGTIFHSGHHIPGLHDTPGMFGGKTIQAVGASSQSEPAAVVTQILLSTPGIEIEAQNSNGQTPLHVACSRGSWSVVRLLLRSGAIPNSKDRRGLTPGQLALKRGMPIPVDLLSALGDALTLTHGAPPRDLIVDPDSPTLLICHELCLLHRSCPPIRRDSAIEPPPENIRRLHVLINGDDGILKGSEFGELVWEGKARRASMVDVLKVHEYNYVEGISRLCAQIPDHPQVIAHLDADTAVSRWSFEAALRAAGSVCDAVDKVVAGDFRNAFCAVRPPGHHAGPRGIVKCANDPEGSHGFCLLNNVAIGAAYARSMYRNDGIRKIAIIDFDVHHGNGTEEIIRQLVPNVETTVIRTPFAVGELSNPRYRPWLDETDINDVFFSSTHGYGPRSLDLVDHPQQGGWFYPASGESRISDAILNPSIVETPNLTDFILSQSWTRMGEESRANCCRIINCGLDLPRPDAIPGMQRLELRDTYRKKILPYLRDFDPDIIFISAGFDAHKRDSMNFGYVGMVEDDYEWVTEQLVKIANTCCNGRIVSVLEGGYKIHGGIVSPFARSVASHVRALVDGGRSRELYDAEDCNWESQFERHIVEDRERKRQQKKQNLHRMEQLAQCQTYTSQENSHADSLMKEPLNDAAVPMEHTVEEPTRKRRRNQVDYAELFEQMKREKSQ